MMFLRAMALVDYDEQMENPLPETDRQCHEGTFDPWEPLDSFLGCYSAEFDTIALEVLNHLLTQTNKGEGLAHQMFREVLCRRELCEYGTSPRTCFPTAEFAAILPDLIAKWSDYANIMWGQRDSA